MKIVRFTASWCADCIVMRPAWAKVKEHFPTIEYLELDLDDNITEAKEYQVTKVPNMIIIDNKGVERQRMFGMQNLDTMINTIEEIIKS